jgi:hypothetical protein
MTNAPVFMYLFKSICLSGICYGYYVLFLKNTLLHQYNRFYLLATLLVSMLGPAIQLDFMEVKEENLAGISETIIYMNAPQVLPVSNQTDWGMIILYIAFGISILLVGYLVTGIARIYRLQNQHSVEQLEGIKFIQTNLENAPFSFLNKLFWKQTLELSSEDGQKIFRHELTHIRQGHTYDRLFCQFYSAIAWFNPFNWIIQKELQNIHEFIADRESIQEGDVSAFAKMLLQAHYGKEFLVPSHSFYYSSIKRRIMLLTTSQNPKYVYLRKVSVLPILAVITLLFSLQVKAQEKEKQEGAKTNAIEKKRNAEIVQKRAELNRQQARIDLKQAKIDREQALIDLNQAKIDVEKSEKDEKISELFNKEMNASPKVIILNESSTNSNVNLSQGFGGILIKKSDTLNADFNKSMGDKSRRIVIRTNDDNILTLPNGQKIKFAGIIENKKSNNTTSLKSFPFVAIQADDDNPLVLIDGVIQKGLQLNQMSSDQIENIESVKIIKGAKAVEKYAEKGISGVIEITTKKNN